MVEARILGEANLKGDFERCVTLYKDMIKSLFFIMGFVVIGMSMMIIKCLVKVPADHAVIRSGQGGQHVSFDHSVVIPVLHQYSMISIAIRS